MAGLKKDKDNVIIKSIVILYVLILIGCVIKCLKQGMVTIDIVALLGLLVGIGLWRLKNWARLGAIFISSFMAIGIITMFVMLVFKGIQPKVFILGREQSVETLGYYLVFIGLFMYFLFLLFQIVYFNLPRVKKLFIS